MGQVALGALLVGLGATALLDAWAGLRRRWLGTPLPDYALLGRWIGGMPAGRLTVSRIAAAPPVSGERPLGTAAHYAIGVTFAWLLLALAGPGWLDAPTLLPALAVGLATIAAPWFVMQPAMGAGFAGSRTPDPRATRLRNLGTHATYGVGMWLTALVLAGI